MHLVKKKKDVLTGRGELAEDEIQMFLDNPFFGIGVGKGTDIRSEKNGFLTASHDEITRMLAEHGALGILGLMILFFTPLIYFLGNKQNLYLFCFITFWFLTINHAAMRTASPSFVYALALLKVRFDDEEVALSR
jgi:O-antigen ligase